MESKLDRERNKEIEKQFQTDDGLIERMICSARREGAKWADDNPSTKTIFKVIALYYACKLDRNVSDDNDKDEIAEYIKQHWKYGNK